MGESALLAELVHLAGAGGRDGVIGPGDDAAGVGLGDGGIGLWSVDSVVEGVDFRRDFQSPYRLGRKAWRVAASDLAAMGVRPQAGLAAALLPPGASARALAAIQLGLVEAAAADRAYLAGGDLSATPGPLALTVTVWGRVQGRAPVRLGGGKAGEALVVTGSLGGAAAALALLDSGQSVPAGLEERLCDPPARWQAGEALAQGGVSAMTDLSDGLLLDLERLCAAAGLGAELWAERLPVDLALLDRLPDRAPELALTGGEDFELLAAVSPTRLSELVRGWTDAGLPPLTEVGVLRAPPGIALLSEPGGRPLPLPERRGHRHF
ncbi:MAG: thiamine-phosphate kinase [Candidatus Dormibacteria bacterium]